MTARRLHAARIITEGDEQDALRVIRAASIIAAIPGFISAEARSRAVTRLREMVRTHPSAEILAAIVLHLESYFVKYADKMRELADWVRGYTALKTFNTFEIRIRHEAEDYFSVELFELFRGTGSKPVMAATGTVVAVSVRPESGKVRIKVHVSFTAADSMPEASTRLRGIGCLTKIAEALYTRVKDQEFEA